VKGTNKILLYVLARLCAPEVGEDGWQTANWADLPRTWPDHFDEDIQILNWRILPALKFSPKELLLSLVVNTTPTPLEISSSIPAPQDFETHMAYTAQQRLDGYSEAVRHAMERKTRFDRRVMESREGEVTFEKGHLVQTYRNDLANSISTERKLTPMWSEPRRVTERMLNSYKLETLDGQPLDGEYHARRLRGFTPREGTELAMQQKGFEAERTEEEPEKEPDEDVEVASNGDNEENTSPEAVEDRQGRLQN
jgi:hypothetical protein